MDTEENNHLINSGNNRKLSLSLPSNAGIQERLQAMLDTYRRTGKLIEACALAGVSHNTHYRKLENDASYRRAFERAEKQMAQRLEDTAYERAMEGDNTLLVVLLKRFKPEHYRERSSVDVTLTVNLADRLTQARNRLIALEKGDSAA